MSITSPVYVTREAVKRALDSAETARNDTKIDRAIESGARAAESACHRIFYPQLATRYFDWPDPNRSRSYRLWLNQHELISVTTLTVAGEVISASDYFLEPVNSGPPYTHVEIDLDSAAEFRSGDTHQRAIALAGLYGYRNDEIVETATAEALDDTETEVTIARLGDIGTGSIVRVDNERMLVTALSDSDTTQNSDALSESTSDVSIAVSDGTAFSVGETIQIGSERMLVVAITGNVLTVKRAWDGSVLAMHGNGSDIYAKRSLTVIRGALGTTAATHLDAATVRSWRAPSLVRDFNLAFAVNQVEQESAAYARTAGSGENTEEYSGAGVKRLRCDLAAAHGRRYRMRAV